MNYCLFYIRLIYNVDNGIIYEEIFFYDIVIIIILKKSVNEVDVYFGIIFFSIGKNVKLNEIVCCDIFVV